MNTTLLPDTETVTTPDDCSGIGVSHFVCGVCYPETMTEDYLPGVPGVCGAKTLGVLAPDNTAACNVCKGLKWLHWLGHMNRGEA